MVEWFRNTDWNDDIAAAFNAKLARSRSQKAQYLRIQGSLLKQSYPSVAVKLLRRCIDIGDEFHVAHALIDVAQAHYNLGSIEEALASLEAAMEQEARHPMFRTSAPLDYTMLVALHGRAERYDAALAILEKTDGGLFPSMEFQLEASKAIVFAARERHNEARAAAKRALVAEGMRTGWIPGHPEVGVVPDANNPLSVRVREIAAGEGS